MNTPCIYCGYEDVVAVNNQGLVHCLWCNGQFQNPNWRDAATARQCPKCQTQGQTMTLWAPQQYECPKCLYVFSGAPR